jgi:hypothetical protein
MPEQTRAVTICFPGAARLAFPAPICVLPRIDINGAADFDPAAGAADLKFLRHARQTRSGTSNRRAAPEL